LICALGGLTEIPVIAIGFSAGGVTETSSPQAASPKTAPAASNDRYSFRILFPLLECVFLLSFNCKTLCCLKRMLH